jgi:hypothetical protein
MDKLKRDAGYLGQTITWKQGVTRAVSWLERQGKIVNSDSEKDEDRLIAAWRAGVAALPMVGPA